MRSTRMSFRTTRTGGDRLRFEFATATRILFGPGSLREVAPLAAKMLCEQPHKRALVVTGRSLDRATRLIDSLAECGVGCTPYAVPGEPTIASVERGIRCAANEQCGLVVAIGGGSAIDAGKAIAALLTNRGDPLDYLEVIGAGKPLTLPPAPFVAIPTTAGTGAEVTRNAVLASAEYRVKVSLRSPLMLPRLAVVDPQLTYGLPADVTASTGLDALSQLIEAFVCIRAQPLTDAICREGIGRAARSLRRACAEGEDPEAREDMALAALFGGLTLANAGLGAVHGFAGPVGGMFGAPHGAVCGVLLPHVMAANVGALQKRLPESEALFRYDETARLLVGDANARAADGVAWVRALCAALRIPPLRSYGVTSEDFALLIQKASAASSMKANPVVLTSAELESILAAAL
jgi:alcohol dehydrogenase class IV